MGQGGGGVAGVPNAVAGTWAVLAPHSWFDSFPGWDPYLVAAEPPYNPHLATDAGAGLLASGVIMIVAAWLGDRRSARLALVGFTAFALPHAGYHVLHPAPGLTTTENVLNAAVLLGAVLAAAGLFIATRPDR